MEILVKYNPITNPTQILCTKFTLIEASILDALLLTKYASVKCKTVCVCQSLSRVVDVTCHPSLSLEFPRQ